MEYDNILISFEKRIPFKNWIQNASTTILRHAIRTKF